MKQRVWKLKIGPVLVLFALSLLTQASDAQNTGGTKARRLGNIDARVNDHARLSKVVDKNSSQLQAKAREQTGAIAKRIANFKAKTPNAEVVISPVTSAVEVVRAGRPLTEAAPGRTGVDIVRNFLSDNRALYGLSDDDMAQLHFIGESVSKGSGLRMVRVEQTVHGRPVFQSETRVTMNRDGRIARSVGLMIPNASAIAERPDRLISAPEALKSAMASVNIAVNPASMKLSKTASDGLTTEIAANTPGISGNVHSKIVYFPVAPGRLIPAWSQVTFTDGPGDWYTLVDAKTGTLLWRKNIRVSVSTQDARFRVYVQADGSTPADNPAPQSPSNVTPGSGTQFPEIAPTTVNMLIVQDLDASPDGWIPDGGSTTTGNNVDAYLDRVGGANANLPDTGALDNNGRPTGNPNILTFNRDFLGTTPRDFETGYLPPPQGGIPETGQTATGDPGATLDSFRRGILTQLFYVTNWYHDRLFNLGFDEAAGNFQQTNFTALGTGNDRVLAEAQDGGSTNNANFSTPPDGQPGRMQMYRFTSPTIDRDGDLDTELVIHELTHGLTNRLVGNADGLFWDVGGALGEGWSDFYALALLNNTNADTPTANYAAVSYATYKIGGLLDNYLYGIRRFPYSTDNSVNPLTWADVDDVTNNLAGGIAADPLDFNGSGAMEVHNAGEIWALSLWEVRSRIIADPAGANGDVPAGNQTTLQLVTDALKLTPINPSFVDGRDALLDADAATNDAANEHSIWAGFADRGLGYKSVAPLGVLFGFPQATHMGVGESFDLPYLDVGGVTINDTLGNNNGAIDPGEPIKIRVALQNPWRSASKDLASASAFLTTSTAQVTITDGTSVYPAIPAQSSAEGDTFSFTVSSSAIAGQALKFVITPTSAIGSRPVSFTLRVGARGGPGTPITYTRTPTVPLLIPDDAPRGVFDSAVITDDFEIADLDFRMNSLTHTFTGDLVVMLKAPNGYGGPVIGLIGGGSDGGPGDNLINMVVDDDLPVTAANDMVQAAASEAPFTRSWLPPFNSPWSEDIFGLPSDPVGHLSRHDGANTKGTWTVLASDQAAGENGTLNSWSLIVRPRLFTVQPFPGLNKYDYSLNGNVDFLIYEASTRRAAAWFLNGTQFAGGAFINPPIRIPNDFQIVDTADFNSDQKPDLLLFNPSTRQSAIWFLNGANRIGAAYGPTIASGFALIGAADFDRDGDSDFLLYNFSSRSTAIWYLNNASYAGGAFGPVVSPGFLPIATGDFNRDGFPDLALFNPSNRKTVIWHLNGPTFVNGVFGPTVPTGFVLAGVASFPGDTKPDFVLFNQNTRRTIVWFLNGAAFVNGAFGPTLPPGYTLAAP